jgi:hypothetical protein
LISSGSDVSAGGDRKPEKDEVTEERLEAAIVVVARAIDDGGNVIWVPLLERLEMELKKMKDARDGLSRARQITENYSAKGKAIF